MMEWSEREIGKSMMLRRMTFRHFRALWRKEPKYTERRTEESSAVKFVCVMTVAEKWGSKEEMPFACLLGERNNPQSAKDRLVVNDPSLSHVYLQF